jgi:hypothetical protein
MSSTHAFPDPRLRDLCRVVEKLGWAVTRDYRGIEELALPPFFAGGETLYTYKRIVIPTGIPPAMVAHPLIHELGHALMHSDVARTPAGSLQRELEARTVAFVVASALDLVAAGQDLGSVLPAPYPTRVQDAIRKLMQTFPRTQTPSRRSRGWHLEAWEESGVLHAVRPVPTRQSICGVPLAALKPPSSPGLRWCQTCGGPAAGTEKLARS